MEPKAQQEPKDRQPERRTNFILFLGYNGCGKSTLVKKFVQAEINKGGRALIVTPDSVEWPTLEETQLTRPARYLGAKKVIYQHGVLDSIRDNYYNGLLVFDDCRAFLRAKTDPTMETILIRRRQMMMDMVAVAHGFTKVPPAFFPYCSHIVLFQTKDNIITRKDYLNDFNKMKEAQGRVNKIALTNPYHYEIIPQ